MDLDRMKVTELRQFLEQNNLPKSGTKAALLQRAKEFVETQDTARNGDAETENNVDADGDITMEEDKDVPPPLEELVKIESEVESVEIKEEEKEEFTASAQHVSGEDAADVAPKEELLSGDENGSKENLGSVDKEVEAGAVEPAATPEKSAKKSQKASGKGSLKRRLRSPVPLHAKLRRISSSGKNPLQIVNELFQGVKYELVDVAAMKRPWFKMRASLNGKEYFGENSSKKEAKHAAAEAILRDFCLPGNMHQRMNIDFTSDDPFLPEVPSLFDPDHPLAMPEAGTPSQDTPGGLEKVPLVPMSRPGQSKPKPEDMHPVMLLNQLKTGLQYDVQPSGAGFEAKVAIDDAKFSGQGKNKKLAKFACAVKALKGHFGIISNLGENLAPVPSSDMHEEYVKEDAGTLPDFVYDKVKSKFAELTDGEERHGLFKVLAGIVMTRTSDLNVDKGEVICVATGTKCINGEYISSQGTALNDCHAEIVCRRGLRRFLCRQLLDLERGEDSVFERRGENVPGYKLKGDVFFHLYISTSPCGDGRVFSPHEAKKYVDVHPNRLSRGQLRTKIEAGEGTIPVQQHHSLAPDGSQPWDSVISGERLLTMSCSDKLARWNLLGVQGSLLAVYVEPVYYSSIILGALFHGTHLSRGLHGRIQDAVSAVSQDCEGVEPPFKIHRPLLAPISTTIQRKPVKAPSFCLHWTIGDNAPTIVNTVTGKLQDDAQSNLCKMEMCGLAKEMLNSTLKPRVEISLVEGTESYRDIKRMASDYQELKKRLHEGFAKAGLGIWVKRPEEVDLFQTPSEI